MWVILFTGRVYPVQVQLGGGYILAWSWPGEGYPDQVTLPLTKSGLVGVTLTRWPYPLRQVWYGIPWQGDLTPPPVMSGLVKEQIKLLRDIRIRFTGSCISSHCFLTTYINWIHFVRSNLGIFLWYTLSGSLAGTCALVFSSGIAFTSTVGKISMKVVLQRYFLHRLVIELLSDLFREYIQRYK